MVTTGLFLWISGLIIAILLAFLIPLLVTLLGLKSDLQPIGSLISEVNTFLRIRGLGTFVDVPGRSKRKQHASLPPEEEAERTLLIQTGNTIGLLPEQAAMLQELLERDARDDLKQGIINAIAFAAIVVAIGVIIKSLSKA